MTTAGLPPEEEIEEKKRPPLSLETKIILAVCSLVVLVNLVVGLSPQPRFCGVCHGQEYAAWERSEHKETGCVGCHRRPNALGMIGQKAEVLGMVLKYPVGLYRRPVTAEVANASCLSCHPSLQNSVSRNGLVMSHKEPDKAGYRCSDCHGDMAHGGLRVADKQYAMSTCMTCHSGDQTANCDLCHVKRTSVEGRAVPTGWQVTHGKEWQKMHGMGDVRTCEACHQSGTFCKRCHNTEMPHASSWLDTHGADAKKNRKGCELCHKQSLCDSCHGIAMPHEKGFLAKHSSIVEKSGRETCDRCHRPDGCDTCHDRHRHPGIDTIRLQNLRRSLGFDD
ncbi:MAG: hypothetical protein ACYC1U_11270 [Candidatus Aquicultorales bacterium]